MMPAAKATGFDSANCEPRQDQNQNTFDQILALTKAKLQIAGFGVHSVEGGHLVVRWGMSKLCADLGELRSFAKKTGAL